MIMSLDGCTTLVAVSTTIGKHSLFGQDFRMNKYPLLESSVFQFEW